MDVLHAALKALDHNRWTVLGLIAALGLCVALLSCQARTLSVLNPPAQVTSSELEREAAQIHAETEAKLKQLEIAQADIRRQVELRARIIQTAGAIGTAAAAGTVTPGASIAAVVQVLTACAAGGLYLDNRRKDKKIATTT